MNHVKNNIDFITMTSSDEMWYKVRNYAKGCSWKAGKLLANAMDKEFF